MDATVGSSTKVVRKGKIWNSNESNWSNFIKLLETISDFIFKFLYYNSQDANKKIKIFLSKCKNILIIFTQKTLNRLLNENSIGFLFLNDYSSHYDTFWDFLNK